MAVAPLLMSNSAGKLPRSGPRQTDSTTAAESFSSLTPPRSPESISMVDALLDANAVYRINFCEN
jgi:hypothetical protein